MTFRAPGADEFDEDAFKPAAEDTYKVRIDRYEIKSGKDTVNQWNKDGNPRVRFFLDPIEIDGDSEAIMVDTADVELAPEKFFMFFFDPDHLGLKPVVAKSRKFLAAALGVPVEQPVEADSLEAFCDSLINRELIVDITINGQYNNVADSRPIRRKSRKQRAEKTDLKAEAEEIFNEDSDGADPDDY